MRLFILVPLMVSLLTAWTSPALADDDEDTSPPIAPQRPMQTGTQSTTLQTGTQSTTLQTGTQSTTLQTGTQSALIQGGTAGSLIQGGVEDESGPVNILFLVDASYSMKEKLGGDTQKMDAAKRVLQDAMQRIPNDINVGLRVFGQNYNAECYATALLVPMGQGNRSSIMRRVQELKPFGVTPLTYALEQAATDDFRGVQGKKVLILITDGADTCGGNPCQFIAQLPRYGIKIKVDVVGVDMHKDANGRAQLNCIAEHSGGKYFDANTAAQLVDSISQSIDKAISGRVIINPSTPAKNTETPIELHPMQPMQQLSVPPPETK